MQALSPGWNVLRDVAHFGVTPHVDNEKMAQLYREGDGFIFETMLFWAKPDRRCWTEEALERIEQYAQKAHKQNSDISILIFGDGTGNDSLLLANHGFKIDYFDVPGSKTFDFAMKRFDAYGFLDKSIRPLYEYKACLNQEYDIVISFEVLEHLPQPLATMKDVAETLKMGGVALITEDFGDITNRLPTHLKVNSRYVGQTPFRFLSHKMILSWYNRQTLFKPMEFVKTDTISTKNWLSLLGDFNVRSAFLDRYTQKFGNFFKKLAYIRF